MLREVDRQRDREDQIKSIMASPFAQVDQIKALWPEFFSGFDVPTTSDGLPDVDQVDDSLLEWAVPQSPQEADDLDSWINSREMSLTPDELGV